MFYKSYDFECNACNHVFNDIVQGSEDPCPCPQCGNAVGFTRLMSAPAVLSKIVPVYPGSKKHKAGYVHTHGDRPAEKAGSQVSMYNPKKSA